MTDLESCLESLKSHCVKGKPNLQWKFYIRDTKIMECLEESYNYGENQERLYALLEVEWDQQGVCSPLEPG